MNSFISPNWVLKDVARLAVNRLKFADNVTRTYDPKFSVNGAKVGYKIDARLPQRFRVVTGQAFQPQAITDATVPVALTDQIQVATAFSTADATMIIDDVRKRYVMPAAEALANYIDWVGLKRMYPYVFHASGVPGTVPTSNLLYALAVAKLVDAAVPEDGLVAILSTIMGATIANQNLAFFQPGPAIASTWRTGQIAGEWMGIEKVYTSQNVPKHTTGTFTASTIVVNGAGQTGSVLSLSGFAAGASTLKRGDVFTIAGVQEVNPMNYDPIGLQQFTVGADTADVAGAMATLSISPAIITSGPLQTVDVSPANNAAVTVVGETAAVGGTLATTISPQGILFHPDAFILAVADLDGNLDGATVERVSSKKLNISLRYVRQYSALTDQKAARIDGLIGWTAFRPEWAVRIYS